MSVSSTGGSMPLDTSPPPHHHGTSNGGGGYGGSYLDGSSLPPSPLEALYRRTASFSRSPSTSPAYQQDSAYHQGGIASDGGRRQFLSGPLPTTEEHSPAAYSRRPSLSGPLPFSSHNPYSTSFFENELLPDGNSSNPYLNPHILYSPGNASVSSGSPSSLPRPPPTHHHHSTTSPSIASPNSIGSSGYGGHHGPIPDRFPRAPPVRQLYGYNNQAAAPSSSDPFASLVSSSNGDGDLQWASFPPSPSQNNQKSLNGKPLAIAGLSQRTHGPSSVGRSSPGDSMNAGLGRGNPSLTRSRSAQNGALFPHGASAGDGGKGGGGVLPFNTRGGLNRSTSCGGAEMGDLAQKYSKGRGGLGEGVLETLVSQLVFAKERPSMLADMIFCPSKFSSHGGAARGGSKGPFAYARDLVERILLAQVHALTPSFKSIAQKSAEFESKNGAALQEQRMFPNEGYRFLRLQTQFVEAGLETFDMLCRVRKQFPSLMMADGGGSSSGLMRIACFGGGPGCEALAIRLFFMRLLPKQLQMQVDMFDRRERWKEIVDSFSLKGVGFLAVDVLDVVFHPTWLRSYRLLVFIDSLGGGLKGGGRAWRSHDWAELWSDLFRNTSPGVVVIVHEKSCPWEEMKPRKGSKWWCSALAEQELVHVARKM